VGQALTVSLRVRLAARMGAAALCAALLVGTAVAQGGRPADLTISEAFRAGKLKGLHAALVILQGETLAEVYFEGLDEHWGRRLGVVHHGPDTLHDIRSITKSVTGLLYGIALAEGKVPGPDAPLLAQFPVYADLVGDPLRDSITVGDALAMKMGTEWNEDLPYTDPRNSEIAMEDSADRYRFVLDRPMMAAPGAQWSYNGGAAALIGKLIEDGTGMALDDYARDKLFQPLGITQWDWSRGADGVPSAASGLRLTARDLGKIGQLVLDGGMFNGRRVVPRDWLDELFTPRTSLFGVRYGYFWWLADSSDPRAWVSGLGNRLADTDDWPAWVGGLGNGGQRLSVQADIGLIVVVLAGDYNDPQDWVMPVRIIEEHVAPELRRRLGK
jgi:CubicO group peptidase (beta-lactamase class C family)